MTKELKVVCNKCNQQMVLSDYLPNDVVIYDCDTCKTFKMLSEKTGKSVEKGSGIRRGA